MSERPDVVPTVARSVWPAGKVCFAAMPFFLWMSPRRPRCTRRVGVSPLLPPLAGERSSWSFVDYTLDYTLDYTPWPAKPTLASSVGSSQSVPSDLPARRRSDFPIHTALTSTTLGDALDGEKRNPKETVRKLHATWGRASSQQHKRTMAEAGGKANRLIPPVGDFVRACEICRAFDVAPAIPVSGTSPASSFNGMAQVDLLLMGDIVALHVLDLFARYSLRAPVRSKKSEEVWGSLRTSRFWETPDKSNGRGG